MSLMLGTTPVSEDEFKIRLMLYYLRFHMFAYAGREPNAIEWDGTEEILRNPHGELARDIAAWIRMPTRNTRSKRRLDAPGYVYLLKSNTGFYKIGSTSNPDNRVKVFKNNLPFDVEFEHLIECADRGKTERELQQKFASKRVRGEWFKLSHSDVAYIKRM